MVPILHIGSLDIDSYNAFVHISFFAAAAYVSWRFLYVDRYSQSRVVIYVISMFFVHVLGGMIIPLLWAWRQSGSFPSYFLTGGAGRYYHSVLLSAIAFTGAYAWWVRWPVRQTLDQVSIAAAIMSPLGRIGCFLLGCCGGKPTTLPWGLRFPGDPHAVHPTQLYHLGFEGFVLLAALILIDHQKRYAGQTVLCYFFLYALFRFWVEFLRTNPITLWGLTHAQLFSLAVIAATGSALAILHIQGVGTRQKSD
jgi:phosphatidylglycerol---prolipoprotein diacylglyceryl transferase